MSKVKRVEMFGPFRYPTGYSHVIRNFAKGFHDDGYLVGLHDFQKWAAVENRIAVPELFDNLQKSAPYVGADVLLSFCLPEQIHDQESPHQNKIIVNYTMFEADGICRQWADFGSMTDYIVVPTQFNKNGWVRSGVNENRVFVSPLGINTTLYSPDAEPISIGVDEELSEKYQYRFMNIQEISDRKNIDGLLRCWIRATEGNKDSCLIIKLSSYSENRAAFFGKRVQAIRDELGIQQGQHAPIFVYLMTLQDHEMPMLLQNCTHYISTSRGEGWDLNAAAAASMNKQLVVPNHSAYPEYLREGHAFLIDSEAKPANQAGALFRLYEDLNWFHIDEDYMVDTIQFCINGEKHADNRDYMVENYDWKVASRKLMDIVDIANGDVEISRKQIKPSVGIVKKPVMIGCTSAVEGKHCGIGEYAKSLSAALGSVRPVGLMNGTDKQWSDHLDNNKAELLHVQHEYQFHSPERMKNLCIQAHSRGIPVVVTQHTLNINAPKHNEVIRKYVDLVLVHSETSKRFAMDRLGYKNVDVVPMPCKKFGTDCKIPKGASIREKVGDRKLVGFFGFSYFHKGLDDLIDAVDDDTSLMIFSKSPEQDVFGYSERCLNKLRERGEEKHFWFDGFHDEEEIVAYLSECDLIVLPYKDYGGVGTSAAASTALRAGVPILVSDTCWFDHLPDHVAPKIYNGDVRGALDHVFNAGLTKILYEQEIEYYVADNSWEEAAECHMKIYKKLLADAT